MSTRERLRAAAWQDGLNSCLKQIRAALGESTDSPRFIETLPRRGCRFAGEVTVEPVHQPDNQEETG